MRILLLAILIIKSALSIRADEPVFKGGQPALERFINAHIIYPTFSKSNCIEGTIYVRFQLDKLGKVISTSIEKGLGIDLDEEAQRVIRLTSGNWIVDSTTIQSTSLVLPVNFSLNNSACSTVSAQEKARAIEYYRIQEGLQNTVFNYYKRKEKGETGDESEADIRNLKEQLGFDEAFIQDKLEEARRKINQKDIDGACKTLQILKNIGSNAGDKLRSQYCN